MARKRNKAKRKYGIRRRRVSGIPGINKDAFIQVAGVVGGLVLSSYASKVIPATLDPKIKSAILLGGGLFLMSQKSAAIKGVATGLAAAGAFQLVNAVRPGTLPAIAGPSFRFDNPSMLSGFNSYPNNPQRNTIAGFNSFPNNPQMNTIAGVRNARAAAGSGL